MNFGRTEYAEECESTLARLCTYLEWVYEVDNVNVIGDIDEKVDDILENQSEKSKKFRRPYMKQLERYEELFMQYNHDLTIEFLLGPI